MINNAQTEWLLSAGDPWVRYRVLVDLLDRAPHDAEVHTARQAVLDDERVQGLIAEVAEWPGYVLKRHNDAAHPIHKFAMLADFGLRADDAMMKAGVNAVIEHQSPEGAFQSLVNIPKAFGGTNEDMWTWITCDTPVLLHALLALGLGDDERVRRAVEHLVSVVDENGWRCVAAPELGKFRGPGRKDDPCPIANLYALRVLAQVPELVDSPAAHTGAEMLLGHWEHQAERKIYMFGIGTTFRRLKYPFVWYDILHVMDTLSRFPFVHDDARFREMLETITAQADEDGRYRAGSMYRAWKGWEFANKKEPSPWITFLVMRILKRVGEQT